MTALRLPDTADRVAFAHTVRSLCADAFRDEGEDRSRPFDPDLWRALGDAGAWGVASSGGGTTRDAVVVAEALGAEAVSGPIVQTYLVNEVLGGLEDIEAGRALAAVSDDDPLVPWGAVADVFVVLAKDGRARRGRRPTTAPAVTTLGGEPWSEGGVVADGPALDAVRACAVANTVGAAYAVGAGGRALELTIDYTAQRKQFGRPLLSFQTVEHRLAHVAAELHVVADLVTVAADVLGAPGATRLETAAALAASSRLMAGDVALRVCLLGHQLWGGMGFVDGTLLATLSRRVQQLAHQPPTRAFAEDAILHPVC